MKAQNRHRAGTLNVQGEAENVFGGDADVVGGSSGSEPPNVPKKAYSFGNHDSATDQKSAPARDQIYMNANGRK